MADKNILLIEPRYSNKYPPLGLMKLAQYHGPSGKNDNVRFIKGEDRSALSRGWDRVYVTTLFSFEWKKTADAIDFAIEAAGGQTNKVFVGGIAASLMHEAYLAERKWRGVRFIKGLLDKPPAISLQLDDFSDELYSADIQSPPIEDLIPDYTILDHIEYKYPVTDAYFAYASRGCIRKCKFCGVPALEGAQRDTPSISRLIRAIEDQYGTKKDLILMDNNVVASPNFKRIIAEIRDLGFSAGATVERDNRTTQRRVDFNQGVDARILCKDRMFLEQLSSICIQPLRIAFDNWGFRAPYEQAIRYAAEFGLVRLSNYMLYNFKDSPKDLYQRMRLNIDLNEELGIRVFSFPMRYQPVTLKDRSHVGPRWNRYYLRSIQLVLQATHGVVSGAPMYFRRAFGATPEEFEELLMRPQHMLFNRDWYEKYEGRGEFDRYSGQWRKLSLEDRQGFVEALSTTTPSFYRDIRFGSKKLRNLLQFYIPKDKDELRHIWDTQRKRQATCDAPDLAIPDDERVEDAGLEDAA